MGYKVTSPLVIVRHGIAPDLGVSYLYEGALLPENPDPDQLEQLLDAGQVVEVEDPEGDEPAGPPAKSASKGDWEAYARSQGATDADLDGQTKDDLIAAYGGESA